MKFRTAWILCVLLAGVAVTALGQSGDFLPLEAVKPGMKGVGKTVFEGAQPEEFDVEILGVLNNVGPKQNLILAKLSGNQLPRTGVFAGMSGSPVYIGGKLVGSVAYAFAFAKEPIAGITPIREMVEIFKEKVPTSFKLAKSVNPSNLYQVNQLSDLFSFLKRPRFELEGGSGLGISGSLHPITTPLNLAGFSAPSLNQFQRMLDDLGVVPVMGAGNARNDSFEDAPLQPGSTVNVQLVRGDMDISASGTVTHVSGDKVYAFGHPFMSMGYTDMPMSKAAVLGVIPSLMNSQKISASTEAIGSIRQDRSTGIMGVQGAKPSLIPVHLTLHTSRNETKDFNYEVVTDNFLTPFLITFTVHNSIISSERAIGGQTLQVKCTISLKGQPDINFENSVSDLASSPTLAAVTAASPVNFILNSGFEDVVMEKIEMEIRAVEQTKEAVLDKVWQDRLEVRAGEEVGVTVFLRKSNGDTFAEKYPVKIPEDLSPGPLKIMVGDGVSVTKTDSKVETAEFVPEDLGQLVRAINNLKKNDRLYIRLFREEQGAVVGGEGLPSLPPSLLAIYNSKKTSGDTRPINRVIYVEHELPSTEYVLEGQKIIEVQVEG